MTTVEQIIEQEAQSLCDIFRQYGAKKTDGAYNKSPSERNPSLTKQNLDLDLFGKIQPGSFRENEILIGNFRIFGLSRFKYKEQNKRLFNIKFI